MASELDWIDDFRRRCDTGETSGAAPALEFYVRAARRRCDGVVRSVFPRFMKTFSSQRDRLLDGYRARPKSDPDWYRNAHELLAVVDDLVESTTLPSWAAELARHEWTLFEIGLQHASFDAPTRSINPTLTAMEYAHDLPNWLTDGAGLTAPDVRVVRVGYYQHPATLASSWIELTAHELAALRVALESLSPASVADELQVPVERVERTIVRLEEVGLLTVAEE